MRYQDFEVTIRRTARGEYAAELTDPDPAQPPLAEAFRLPYPRRQLLRLPEAFERLRKGELDERSPFQSAEAIGQALFASLFAGGVGDRFRRRLSAVEPSAEEGLRIRLAFDLGDPRLAVLLTLPWELLRDGQRDDFLGRIRQTPIVRYLPVSRPAPQPLDGPLRILVVQSAPKEEGLRPLNLAAEWRRIWTVGATHPAIHVSSLEHPTLLGLRDKLLEEKWHVLHFMGHGGFDAETGDGCLYLEKPTGRADRVTGRMLGEYLKAMSDLRLVVLNACQTGRLPCREGQNPFTGTAPALLRAGIPAVLAMQAPISDAAAIAFSTRFYERIAAGDPVDAAVVEGRLAILEARPLDWATPVLFTRVSDGDILGQAGRPVPAESSAPTRSARDDGFLRLGIRSFSDTGHRLVWGEEMDEECDDILDLRPFFGGPDNRYIQDAAWWDDRILPELRRFLAQAARSRRPLHLNFAAHSSLAFAAGYILEAKSGLDITLRQRGESGVVEWRGAGGSPSSQRLYRRQADRPRDRESSNLAVALGVTRPVLQHVEHYATEEPLAVRRILPLELADPSQTGVRDGFHALQLAQAAAAQISNRPAAEQGGTVHLFASAPNALLFFLGQQAPGFGRVQLYEYDFATMALGAYSRSLRLPPQATA